MGISIAIIAVGMIALLCMGPRAPMWARAKCSNCGGKVKWLKGKCSKENDEALFECKKCGTQEHRGGCTSEAIMESWERDK